MISAVLCFYYTKPFGQNFKISIPPTARSPKHKVLNLIFFEKSKWKTYNFVIQFFDDSVPIAIEFFSLQDGKLVFQFHAYRSFDWKSKIIHPFLNCTYLHKRKQPKSEHQIEDYVLLIGNANNKCITFMLYTENSTTNVSQLCTNLLPFLHMTFSFLSKLKAKAFNQSLTNGKSL